MTRALLPKWRDDWAVFLDVDGTLLQIAATPADVRVPERIVGLLARLRTRLGGALALVSGRRVADLDSLFAPLKLPTAGAHGAERRDALGRWHGRDYRAQLAPARELLSAWARKHPGALLEDKGAALALHYRAIPELEDEARRAATAACAAVGPDFHVQDGKRVLEIKVGALGKGQAIAQFMSEPPFHGRAPVFLGDDLTDEDGFEVVNRLGGHSIAVGVRRDTCARWHLGDETEVLQWLESGVGGGLDG
jgi:trehalose 6-phosphate phosphatase